MTKLNKLRDLGKSGLINTVFFNNQYWIVTGYSEGEDEFFLESRGGMFYERGEEIAVKVTEIAAYEKLKCYTLVEVGLNDLSAAKKANAHKKTPK